MNAKNLGLSGGILCGLSLFIMTVLSLYTGYADQFLGLISNVYPGYHVSWPGAFLGLLYAFIDSFIFFFLLAWIYNRLNAR